MSRIFVCSTQFQIISILCLMSDKSKDFTTKPNDIIIEHVVPHSEAWGNILSASGIFRNVYVLTKGAHFGPLSLPKRILFTRKLRGKIHITWRQWLRATFGDAEKFLKTEIKANNQQQLPFNPKIYDEYYIASLTALGIALANHFKPLNVKTYIFDEGVGSYVGCVWQKRVTPEVLYLFDTELIDKNVKIESIASLSNLQGTKLLETVQKELKITQESLPDFVFFDQWLAMPSIHDTISFEGWQASDYITKKVGLLKRIADCIGEHELGMKLHPASCIPEVFEFYNRQQLRVLSENYGVPFELSACVAKKRPKCLLTVFSSAVITPLTLGIDQNIKVILLWKLFKNDKALKQFTKDNSISIFFEKVRQKYPNNIYIPNSESELMSILKTL